MKTVRQLFVKYQDQDILSELFRLYPGEEKNEKGYLRTMLEWLKLRPVPQTMVIYARRNDVSGRELNDDTRWGIGLMPYKELLGCKVRKSSLQALCHILWEATWYGYTDASHKRLIKEWGNPSHGEKEQRDSF